jgi:hypothetical protein
MIIIQILILRLFYNNKYRNIFKILIRNALGIFYQFLCDKLNNKNIKIPNKS